MRFDDLDVPILAEAAGGFLDEVGEQVHAQRGVAGLQHRDPLRRRVEQPVVALFQPGGADDDGPLRRDRGVERRLQRGGAGEIDQHVALPGQKRDVAVVLVDAARVVVPGGGNRLPQRLSHAAFAADDADPRHCNSSTGRASWPRWRPFATSSSSPAPGSAPKAASTRFAMPGVCGSSTASRTWRRPRRSRAILNSSCASTTCAAPRSRPRRPTRRMRRWHGWIRRGRASC